MQLASREIGNCCARCHQLVFGAASEGGGLRRVRRRCVCSPSAGPKAGHCSEAAGPWGIAWGTFLSSIRARHSFHPARLAWQTSRTAIHAHLRELVGRPGSRCALLHWHVWWRFGAAQLRFLGEPTPSILRWGGWVSPQMLRIYAYLGGTWSFHRGGPLVQPRDLHARELQWCDTLGTSLQLWAPWLRVGKPRVQSLPAPRGRQGVKQPDGSSPGGMQILGSGNDRLEAADDGRHRH